MPGHPEGPAWWEFDKNLLAVYRPGIDQEPPLLNGRERKHASPVDINSPISAHSESCEFRLFNLGCRCADRSLGPGRTLAGPVFCRSDESILASLPIMLLTAFIVTPNNHTSLVLVESARKRGCRRRCRPSRICRRRKRFCASRRKRKSSAPQQREPRTRPRSVRCW